MLFKFHKKGKELSDRELLKQTALGKINYLSRKRFSKKTIDEIYWILNVFFKSYFNIRKELNYTEIIGEIEKKRIDEQTKGRIAGIFNFFLDVKYKEKGYKTKDLRNIVKEAKDIIRVI